MFTGIIEEIGIVKTVQKKNTSMSIEIITENLTDTLQIGDSIATNGVCLTVTDFNQKCFKADIMPETFNRTNLKFLKKGDIVNLESAMTFYKKFGGHVVQGHVDETSEILNILPKENSYIYSFKSNEYLNKYIILKGSVTIDGISLTVMEKTDEFFSVSIIPQTLRSTSIFKKHIGDIVNIECDLVGKYIENLIFYNEKSKNSYENLDEKFLIENGFI